MRFDILVAVKAKFDSFGSLANKHYGDHHDDADLRL